jgi:hypothetical protein
MTREGFPTRKGERAQPAVGALFVLAFAFAVLCPGTSVAQDSTVFVDDFQSFSVGTMATGCGAMTVNSWRWESQYYHACYSAGWGVDYQAPMSSATPTDKRLLLWGGVPYSGGGDCAATFSSAELQDLTDYSVTVRVTPLKVVDGVDGCKKGVAGVAGRVQGLSSFCSGYLLALVLTNGESLCGQGSLLQLLRNERGPDCNGSEAMTVLASEPVEIPADSEGMFDPYQEYVLKLCFSGSDVYGGVWTSQNWQNGEGAPAAEVAASDETYASGTIGLYEGAARAGFDDVTVITGAECMAAAQDGLVADLDFDPNTLNVKSKGKYVTCYVQLSEGYDPWDVDLETVLLNGAVPAEMRPTGAGDYDEDGIDERMIKFKRSDLVALLEAPAGAAAAGGSSGGAEWSMNGGLGSASSDAYGGAAGGAEWSMSGTSGGGEYALAASDADTVEVWVSGLLGDGTAFTATDTIRVIGMEDGAGPSGSDGNNGKKAGKDAGASAENEPLLSATPTLVAEETHIDFELAQEGHVSVSVYDAAGRMVRRLVDDYRGAGVHDVIWDRTDAGGRRVPPGVYFIRVNQAGHSNGQKLMVVK